MKILVPVKQVAILDEDFELDDTTTTVDPDFLEHDLNEWDSFSVEAALQLRDAVGDGEVVVVSVGDDDAEEGLLACLAKGADRAVRVDVGEDGPADSLAVARLLAVVAARESFDLVLCGVQSSDAVNGTTGVALAAIAELPYVAVVRSIELVDGAGALVVGRELEGGTVEQVRVSLPALLTVQTGINEPRYANLRAIKMAASKPMEVLTPDELGLDGPGLEAASGARISRLAMPAAGRGAQMLEGDADAVAERIAAIIKEAGVA